LFPLGGRSGKGRCPERASGLPLGVAPFGPARHSHHDPGSVMPSTSCWATAATRLRSALLNERPPSSVATRLRYASRRARGIGRAITLTAHGAKRPEPASFGHAFGSIFFWKTRFAVSFIRASGAHCSIAIMTPVFANAGKRGPFLTKGQDSYERSLVRQ